MRSNGRVSILGSGGAKQETTLKIALILTGVIDKEVVKIKTSFLILSCDIEWFNDRFFDSYKIWFSLGPDIL